MTGVLYLSYFVVAGIGQVLATRDPASAMAAAVQVGGTLWYGAVAVMLCRLFGEPTRGAGALAMVSAVTGCVLQALYYALGLGRGAELLALAFFGLFLFFLGYLAFRSALIPRVISGALMVGGLASLAFVLPVPAAVLGPVLALGAASEGFLMLWLVVRGTRPS